tara:strand:- start:831 stop:1115 length:285 start_codon:yes stop_codon:yes gene_type:complete
MTHALDIADGILDPKLTKSEQDIVHREINKQLNPDKKKELDTAVKLLRKGRPTNKRGRRKGISLLKGGKRKRRRTRKRRKKRTRRRRKSRRRRR